jgi:hypothetical protein
MRPPEEGERGAGGHKATLKAGRGESKSGTERQIELKVMI